MYCLMTPVQSREEQHSVSPGSLQLSLGLSPTPCSGALRCFVLKYNLARSVFVHSESSAVSLGHDRPSNVDGQCVKVTKGSRVSTQDRAGCLCLASKWELLLKGGGTGHTSPFEGYSTQGHSRSRAPFGSSQCSPVPRTFKSVAHIN